MSGLKTVLLFFLIVGRYHPVHVSMTNVEYIQEENVIRYSLKMFKDDFKGIISKNYGHILNYEEKFNDKDKHYIKKYIDHNFNIQLNSKELVQTKFVNYKTNDESIWIYFNCDFEVDLKELYIKNSLLLDMFDDQKNLVIFKHGKSEKGYMLNNRNKNIEITF